MTVVEDVRDESVVAPPHYITGEIECIDAMRVVFGDDAVKAYCQLAHFKYVWRHRYKGTAEQDIDKANWYWRMSRGDDPRKDR